MCQQTRAPIGSFISIWYGEDGDDEEKASKMKRSMGMQKRAPNVQVS
jgi:hypothetical protein